MAVDRTYIDFEWLNNMDSNGVAFVLKLKNNISYQIVKEHPLNEKIKDLLNEFEVEKWELKTLKLPLRDCEWCLYTMRKMTKSSCC